MEIFEKYLVEIKGTEYKSKTEYSARVVKIGGKHVAKFFKNGEHMQDADYEGHDEEDAHEFATDELKHREKSVSERINMPQGHEDVPDKIADGAIEKRGRIKKMMGNRMPMEIIARILSKKV